MLDRKFNLRLVVVGVLIIAAYYTFGQRARITYNGVRSADKDDYSNVIPRKDRSGFRNIPDSTIHPIIDWVDHTSTFVPKDNTHRIIYSQSTKDKKYFHVDFAGDDAYNVNIIPHPTDKGKWIVIAQHDEYRDDINSSEQIACIAEFVDGVLHCPKWPNALPIAPSINGQCEGEWAYTNLRRGPRDARVFYGPDQPYIIYGSLSHITCLGLWIQNLWMLLDGAKHPDEGFARGVTEIQRPKPRGQIQKNFFLFWDNKSQIHAHYDMYPKRAFAQLHYDGSVVSAMMQSDGLDLAPFSADQDDVCINKLFPKLDPNLDQGIHQGTNSLAITMCKRADPSCVETDDNTFILHIIQHKTYSEAHGIYEPYPVLFRRRAPFELYAVAQKPLWYHGRDLLTEKTQSRLYKIQPELTMPTDHTIMVYTTSISWRDHSQTYHGYMDDVLFLGFGVEDTRSAAIDVLASDILQDLAYC